MAVLAHPAAGAKRRVRATEAAITGLIALTMIAVHLMFFFWPFRYRMVIRCRKRSSRAAWWYALIIEPISLIRDL